jgi:formate/nitrite transporter FocA (FNT family)
MRISLETGIGLSMGSCAVQKSAAARKPETEIRPKAAAASATQKSLGRPSAEEIFKQVASNARQELQRPSIALCLSGFGAGFFMGLSALGTAMAVALLGTSNTAQIISRMFYPVGFIVVILGRSQLFTENTLYPVALVLAEKREFWNTLRLWAAVLPANVAGAFCFAMLAARTSGLAPDIVDALSQLGANAIAHPSAQVFWSGVIAGWIIALAAWIVSGSHSITGSVMVIWMLMFLVGLGNFAHCVATTCEIFVTVLTNHAPWTAFTTWIFPAVSGNICGGVGLVTMLEYGQVMQARTVEAAARKQSRRDDS